MSVQHLPQGADSPPRELFQYPEDRTVASYESELSQHRVTEIRLREALAREAALLRQKDEVIQQLQLLSKECDHRLLNDLQMIVSLLSLQSHASKNAETASQLAAAADRITTIGRIHRRLHYFDGVQTVAFKQFLENICCDFSTMLSSDEQPERSIVAEAIEIDLPSEIAIPLGFIVNELITNAAKHGSGRIAVRLEPNAGKGYALSVSNEGPGLPEGFDPAAGKGLGMRIIRFFFDRIGGELRIGRGDNDQGARFTVLFS
jgi:two-component system, sensor histidine kinase PdtaS